MKPAAVANNSLPFIRDSSAILFLTESLALVYRSEKRDRWANREGLVQAFASRPSVFSSMREAFWASARGRLVSKVGFEPATQFSLRDTQRQPRKLSDFLNKPTIIIFTSPHCEPCKTVYPMLNEIRNDAVNFVLLCRGATATNRRIKQEYALDGVDILGSRKAVDESFQVIATPFAILVDVDGNILKKGVATPETMREMLRDASHPLVRSIGGTRNGH